jgi:TolA-binding protein
MHDPDSAERLFHETLKRYPDSPAASFARERLAQ